VRAVRALLHANGHRWSAASRSGLCAVHHYYAFMVIGMASTLVDSIADGSGSAVLTGELDDVSLDGPA
jgi:hypothetical protein